MYWESRKLINLIQKGPSKVRYPEREQGGLLNLTWFHGLEQNMVVPITAGVKQKSIPTKP